MLRPQPGNAATVARLTGAGLTAIAMPLFEVAPLPWSPPPAAAFDGLLLTSANALRQGGAGLASLRALPVLAVGAATATAARGSGFTVKQVGENDLIALLAGLQAGRRLLWLAGQDRTPIDHPAIASTIAVYEAMPVRIAPSAITVLRGGVALIHSARAATQLADAIDDAGVPRASVRLAAISAKAAHAAGHGWDRVAVAERPNDEALVAIAHRLAIDP